MLESDELRLLERGKGPFFCLPTQSTTNQAFYMKHTATVTAQVTHNTRSKSAVEPKTVVSWTKAVSSTTTKGPGELFFLTELKLWSYCII